MEILRHHLRNIGYDKQGVDISIIARGTIGFSGADLQALVNQAAVKASADGANAVHGSHFEWAKERVSLRGFPVYLVCDLQCYVYFRS
jgi:ATP-dependent metalloprotease